MKKQKAIKLQLINFLSDPKIEVYDWSIENEIKEVEHSLNCNPWLWVERIPTGLSYLKLCLKTKNDNNRPSANSKG
jgi:hypothetical protein